MEVELSIGSTAPGVGDVARAADLWMAALDYVPRDPSDTWVVLVPRDGEGAQLALALGETSVQDHPRVHLDLYARGANSILHVGPSSRIVNDRRDG